MTSLLTRNQLVACPVCYGFSAPFSTLSQKQDIQCNDCKRLFKFVDKYQDMTIFSNHESENQERIGLGTILFRFSFLSWIYERGYRQQFSNFGFPGADKEVQLAYDYFSEVWGKNWRCDVAVDLSCGSGLFTRRLATNKQIEKVVALDYSENMLKQVAQFNDKCSDLDQSKIAIVRGDVGRLPFQAGSVSAIYSGAGMHCWPSPLQGLLEVSRVLKPGGVFVGSTILNLIEIVSEFTGVDGASVLQRYIPTSSFSVRTFYEQDIKDMCKLAGLTKYQSTRKMSFIQFAVQKPLQS